MLWAQCLDQLRQQLPDNAYALWIRPLHAQLQDKELVLYAPNAYFSKKIQDDYLELIARIVSHISDGNIERVNIRLDTGPTISESASTDLDLAQEPVAEVKSFGKQLNPMFTFEQFVEGRSNQMAAQTCRGIVDDLGGGSHNPLFIYGPTGLGKTHLMHAVGHSVLGRNGDAKVMYMTSEHFVHGFVGALKQGKIEDFKRQCRSLDLLLVDDIHLLAGKDKSLEEFFYTFNALVDDSKQIILTSDRYPKELTELDARLVSRFSWGLSVALEPPDLDTRTDILLKKAVNLKLDLPRECAIFIAQQVIANVRELEGALNKVAATARFKGAKVDYDIIKEALKDHIAIRARTITIDNIQKVVAEYFKIPMKELLGSKRTRNIARPRQMAMGLARELTGESFPDIGSAFGGRDHSTVMHACDKVKELCQSEPGFGEDYRQLLRLLQI